MSQRFLSSLSAALVFSTLGVVPSSYGSEVVVDDEGVEENVPSQSTLVRDLPESPLLAETAFNEPFAQALSESNAPSDPVKIGEYQSQVGITDNQIAVIHSHVMDGRQAATLYVGGIPVLTFLGDDAVNQAEAYTSQNLQNSQSVNPDRLSSDALDTLDDSASSTMTEGAENKDFKLPSSSLAAKSNDSTANPAIQADSESQQQSQGVIASNQRSLAVPPNRTQVDTQDPIQQATAIAAQLNQLHRNGVDGSNITAEWSEASETYVIRVGDQVLVEFDSDIILPDTTENRAEDILQATNRIRRQFGNAAPLNAIEGTPNTHQENYVAVGPIQFTFTGIASWYGPGFHGRRTASGAVFDQHALTAAHRTLPFGTLVRVTNMNNGTSVTVRITDRGPFGGGRVLDLSAGAARAIGMIRSGVAPVRVDVVSDAASASQ